MRRMKLLRSLPRLALLPPRPNARLRLHTHTAMSNMTSLDLVLASGNDTTWPPYEWRTPSAAVPKFMLGGPTNLRCASCKFFVAVNVSVEEMKNRDIICPCCGATNRVADEVPRLTIPTPDS
jgi:hypothetical protein